MRAPLQVLVVGALTRTGQQVVRSLAARHDDFSVTVLCGRETGGSAWEDAPSQCAGLAVLEAPCSRLGTTLPLACGGHPPVQGPGLARPGNRGAELTGFDSSLAST